MCRRSPRSNFTDEAMNPATALTAGVIGGLFLVQLLASAWDARKTKPQSATGAKDVQREPVEERVGSGSAGELRSAPGSEAHRVPEEHLRVIERKLFKSAKNGRFVKAPVEPAAAK